MKMNYFVKSKIRFLVLLLTALFCFSCKDVVSETEQTYSVTYHPGLGHVSGTVPVDEQKYLLGVEVTVKLNTGNLMGAVIQDGIKRSLIGWSTEEDGTGYKTHGGAKFSIQENVQLYARYSSEINPLLGVGPAGGRIIYDAGSEQSWGRYIEVAPSESNGITWGPGSFDPVAVETEIGTGKSNTDAILSDITYGAADFCNSYTVDCNGLTYSDWFLPSKDEIANIATYFRYDPLYKGTYYWSSTQDSENAFHIWGKDFANLEDVSLYQSPHSSHISKYACRPVRYF